MVVEDSAVAGWVAVALAASVAVEAPAVVVEVVAEVAVAVVAEVAVVLVVVVAVPVLQRVIFSSPTPVSTAATFSPARTLFPRCLLCLASLSMARSA